MRYARSAAGHVGKEGGGNKDPCSPAARLCSVRRSCLDYFDLSAVHPPRGGGGGHFLKFVLDVDARETRGTL